MKNELKKSKFNKVHKGRLKKSNLKSNMLQFGTIGLKALESGTLNFSQVESAKQTILKKTKQKVKIWLKTFFYLPISSKPIGTRMGKGKGAHSYNVARVKAGTVIFELSGKNLKSLIISLINCKYKLPIKTKVCYK